MTTSMLMGRAETGGQHIATLSDKRVRVTLTDTPKKFYLYIIAKPSKIAST